MELWPENVYAEFALACVAYQGGALELALARLDRVLRLSRSYSGAIEVRRRVLEAIAERDRFKPRR